MQKKVLALAIAGVLSAPLAAQAQNVQIYGLLQPSFDVIDNGDDDGNFIQSNSSRLGFKGSEDLGGGLKAIFQLESALSFDERGDGTNWMNRDSWVGLAGSFGSLTIGNHQSAYVKSTSSLDPFSDTIGDYNNVMGMVRSDASQKNFDDRFRNSVYYTSPSFGGFQILASYALKSEGFDNGTDFGDDDTYSLAGTWKSGAFAAMVAYEKQKGFTGEDASAWKIGGSFKVLPSTTLYAMVDRIDTDISGVDERTGYYLAAKHSMGSIDLLANFMVAGETDADDDGAKAFTLGAVYNFSKRTNIGAYYAQVNNDDFGRYSLGKTTYAPAGNNAAGEGIDVKGFSIRLKHAF